jgi:non-ribosomal peptide synthetase-like protein
VHIGAGATIEPDVDLHGWWYDGQELVVGEIRIGAGARIGMRTMLMPGSVVGDGAEVEPGSVVDGEVPAGERWAGSPAQRVGLAGDRWPAGPAAPASTPWRQRLLFGAGLLAQTLLPIVAFAPAVATVMLLGIGAPTLHSAVASIAVEAVVLTVVSLLTYALVVAGVVRATGRLLRPGWHAEDATVGWALWFSENVMTTARAMLFPLMCSIYTRPWLRLMGVEVGRRTEISTVVGVNRLSRFGARSFATDDVVLCGARARDGWLHVGETVIGDGTFLGNGALLEPGTTLGDRCLVGVLTTPPADCADGTSWFGAPALELPRVADVGDPARTTDPPRRLVLARGVMDLLRILLPSTASLMLGFGVLEALQAIGSAYGIPVMAVTAPLVIFATGLVAIALTVAVKWIVIGRYRVGEHPLWSLFVWRDELINSAQEQLAGAWLMSFSIGTPLMSAYLRLLGAKVGRDVWCETMALTEFDLVTLGDGAVVNRHACVETHLFHDRLLRIGPSTFEAGATLGPSSAVLPDTHLGAGCVVGARSVVLRGEELPAGTRWVGAPVASA